MKYINTSQKQKKNKKNRLPSNGEYNFQIICHVINSIPLLDEAFNKAHLDTSLASIDPKLMKLHPIEGPYPGI